MLVVAYIALVVVLLAAADRGWVKYTEAVHALEHRTLDIDRYRDEATMWRAKFRTAHTISKERERELTTLRRTTGHLRRANDDLSEEIDHLLEELYRQDMPLLERIPESDYQIVAPHGGPFVEIRVRSQGYSLRVPKDRWNYLHSRRSTFKAYHEEVMRKASAVLADGILRQLLK